MKTKTRTETTHTDHVPQCPAFVKIVADAGRLFGLDATGAVWEYERGREDDDLRWVEPRWQRIGRPVDPVFLD